MSRSILKPKNNCPRVACSVIQGVFHDNFPGFSGFGFCRKLVRTKNKQGTYKVSKHNVCTVFLLALVFRTHQQNWRQIYFIVYPLFVLLPHNLRQLLFSPPPLTPPLPPPPTPPEQAASIIYRVPVTTGVAFLYLIHQPLPSHRYDGPVQVPPAAAVLAEITE